MQPVPEGNRLAIVSYGIRLSPWRVNFPNFIGLVCSVTLLAMYGIWPRLFSTFGLPTAGEWVLLCAIWLISSALAMSMGLLGLIQRHRHGGKNLAALVIMFGFINGLAFPFVRQIETKQVIEGVNLTEATLRCAANMTQIGQAMNLYENENSRKFPDRLEDLLSTQDIPSSAFICPFTRNTPASGPTTQALANNLSAGGHLSYVYLGKGLKNDSNPQRVVLFEPLSNHGNAAHFLFADGHIEFIKQREASDIIKQLGQGLNPLKR